MKRKSLQALHLRNVRRATDNTVKTAMTTTFPSGQENRGVAGWSVFQGSDSIPRLRRIRSIIGIDLQWRVRMGCMMVSAGVLSC